MLGNTISCSNIEVVKVQPLHQPPVKASILLRIGDSDVELEIVQPRGEYACARFCNVEEKAAIVPEQQALAMETALSAWAEFRLSISA